MFHNELLIFPSLKKLLSRNSSLEEIKFGMKKFRRQGAFLDIGCVFFSKIM